MGTAKTFKNFQEFVYSQKALHNEMANHFGFNYDQLAYYQLNKRINTFVFGLVLPRKSVSYL